MKTISIKKMYKALCLLATVFLTAYLSGCASDGRNQKYVPWNMETSTPIVEPEISSVQTKMSKKSNYWSFLYLFGVYEVDEKYAGFDILYFLDFTKNYNINNVAYENEGSILDFDFIPSRSNRLKKLTLGEMAMKSRSDIIMSPMYKLESNDWFFFQSSDCKASCYGGRLHGFKVKGQGYKDALMPSDKPVNTPILVKGNNSSNSTSTSLDTMSVVKDSVGAVVNSVL